MLQRCPHCNQSLQSMRYGAPLGPLGIRIIDSIIGAGPAGITTGDLLRAAYHDRKGATVEKLKTYIASINAALAGKGYAIRIDRYSDCVTVGRRA